VKTHQNKGGKHSSDRNSYINRWQAGKGCNWTLGGLFQIHTLETVDADGNATPVFEFAPESEAAQ